MVIVSSDKLCWGPSRLYRSRLVEVAQYHSCRAEPVLEHAVVRFVGQLLVLDLFRAGLCPNREASDSLSGPPAKVSQNFATDLPCVLFRYPENSEGVGARSGRGHAFATLRFCTGADMHSVRELELCFAHVIFHAVHDLAIPIQKSAAAWPLQSD